jgi:hypothetical protein
MSQRRWNRAAGVRSRVGSDVLYALVAAFVSLLWVVDLAVAGIPLDQNPRMNLQNWIGCAPGMLVAGIFVAFLFRSHMSKAPWGQAAFSSIAIGLLASLIAATIPFFAPYFGPIVFGVNWMITIPMSWFSFWIMRRTDAALRRRNA